MSKIQKVLICFIIFSMFLQIEAALKAKWIVKTMNILLGYTQWKNINDVESVLHEGVFQRIDRLAGITSTPATCDQDIRRATLFLSCSYLNILKVIFLLVEKFQECCVSLLKPNSDKTESFQCSEELINTILNLTSLFAQMRGAIVSMDKLHTHPWERFKQKNNYVLFKGLSNLQGLQLTITPIFQKKNVENILYEIKTFLSKQHADMSQDIKKCVFNELDTTSLFNKLLNKYQTLTTKGNGDNTQLEFYHFLKEKIEKIVEWTKKNRYEDLGFFQDDDKKTCLPLQPEQCFGKTYSFK